VIAMEDQILYKERLPKYNFRGIGFDNKKVIKIQWILRTVSLIVIFTAIFIILKAFISFEFIYYFTLLILTLTCIFLLLIEKILKRELDGCVPTIIKKNSIVVPSPRLYRTNIKIIEVPRDTIKNASIICGNMAQLIDDHQGILWKKAPISLVLKLENGKKIHLGFKPPRTVIEISDVLKKQWAIPIDNYNGNTGHGTFYSDGKEKKDLSFEEIMKMDLFEFQD
jgi:hypothetical protein